MDLLPAQQMVMKTAMNRVTMKKALVVEDHPDMSYLLTRQLKMLGFSVTSASNSTKGVEKALKEKPHLILMDIMMPGMDGREATRIIRSNRETQDIPILAATALFRESDLSSCIESGCNDYLVKPFTFEELKGKVKDIIPGS